MGDVIKFPIDKVRRQKIASDRIAEMIIGNEMEKMEESMKGFFAYLDSITDKKEVK